MEGVQEDVIEIILNMKQLAVRLHTDGPVTLTLTKKGKGPVTAADIARSSDVDVINTDLHIATVTDDKKTFEMEIIIGKGRGYVPVGEKETKQLSLGTIAVDSLYTPIRDIGYGVENTRVGDVTDYEKLNLTIETNGTVSPREAVSQATKILMDHFALILDKAGETGEEEAVAPEEVKMVETPAEEVVGVVEEVVSEEESEDETDEKKAEKKAKKTSKSKKK